MPQAEMAQEARSGRADELSPLLACQGHTQWRERWSTRGSDGVAVGLRWAVAPIRTDAAVVLTALRDDQGQPRGFIKLTQDISERRRAECQGETLLRDAEAARDEAGRMSHAKGISLHTTLPGGPVPVELMRRLRQRPPEPGGAVPASASTAHASTNDIADALAAGCPFHLAKPVSAAAQIAALSFLAGRGT